MDIKVLMKEYDEISSEIDVLTQKKDKLIPEIIKLSKFKVGEIVNVKRSVWNKTTERGWIKYVEFKYGEFNYRIGKISENGKLDKRRTLVYFAKEEELTS